MKKKKKLSDILYVVLFLICIAVFFVSAFFLVEDIAERLAANNEYKSLRSVAVGTSDNPFLVNEAIKELSAKNSHTVGRIIIEDTNIDYPVVRGEDNSFYLTHAFSKKPNGSGCIFVDYRNTVDFSQEQTIIYGHKMRTGTMFNNLKKFKQSSFMKKKPAITIYTEEKTLVYEAVYTVLTKDGGSFITLSMGNGAFLEKCRAASVTSQGSASESDRLLILFTCDGEDEDGRELVIAKLVSETYVAGSAPQTSETTDGGAGTQSQGE